MTPDFERAIGGLADIAQWFVWQLVWSDEEGKYLKVPWANGKDVDAGLPRNWTDYDGAVHQRELLDSSAPAGVRYALGFRLTADCGYWFLDIDNAGDSAFAQQLVAAFPGAMVERSSSGKGLHVFGMGTPPAHRTRPLKEVARQLAPLSLEFYHENRGIAFGLDGQATGCADTRFDVAPLCAAYFPPRAVGDGAVRPEWRGPANDDVLIERMLASKPSADVAFGGKLSVQQLWRGDAEKNSDNDGALATHLAFWTGCDSERMQRLMLRSGMVREKWSKHRTYLELTCDTACDVVTTVYQEPERNVAVQSAVYATPQSTTLVEPGASSGTVARISDETYASLNRLLDAVAGCSTLQEMHNSVFAAISEAGLPVVLQSQVVTAVQARLKIWGAPMPIGQLRATLFPPAARAVHSDGAMLPVWAQPYCFVVNGDRFYNTLNNQYVSMVGFQAIYGREMPINDQGRRENAAERCLHFWDIPLVDQVGYRPDQPSVYTWDGVRYANSYSPTSLPPVAPAYTAAGLAGIAAFQVMLFDMCGRREDVYLNLLYWMAHNVQQPGVKIRWSPILKGAHGDGKTLAAMVLRAAMGYRNMRTTSNANIRNSGGFTDWAVRGAVNVIEEIMLTGQQRHQLYNAMKEFISNNIVDVNPKGATPYETWNCTNHWANTNHNDALPLEKTDRRWFVIFTPWATLDDMRTYCGLDAAGWKARTDAIDHAKNYCAGELRAWFLSLPIPETFDINGSAPETPEKKRMMASSADNAESVAAAIIEQGAPGVTATVISSSHLSRLLEIRSQVERFEMPRGMALNHMLNRLGFSKLEKQLKWQTQTHTVWVKNGIEMTNEDVRLKLDNSNLTQT